jgi:hypothetical protein
MAPTPFDFDSEWTLKDELLHKAKAPFRLARRIRRALDRKHAALFGWNGSITRFMFRLRHPVIAFKLWRGSH